jgi:hypothetical protein
MRPLFSVVLLLLGLAGSAVADPVGVEPRTAHTYVLAEGASAPAATVEDVAWLAGRWVGEGFGKRFEEYWSAPSAGTMLGTFKLLDGDRVDFYEIMELAVTNGRLGLKVKHFSRDFVAWEDKSEYVHFKLVALEDHAAHFAGISFYRLSDDALEAYIVMRRGDGYREEKLTYRRVD